MKIDVLGSGCTKCTLLAHNAKLAADKLGLTYELNHVTNIKEFVKFGVIFTPALVVDGAVVVSGRVPPEAEILHLLIEAAKSQSTPARSG